MAREVDLFAPIRPKSPDRWDVTVTPVAVISRVRPSSGPKTSLKSTCSSIVSERVWWTSAIVATRLWAFSRAARVSSLAARLDCILSRAETVWRLFLTRWLTSRIVASLLTSSCSRLRSSVTSRHMTIPPRCLPRSRNGTAFRDRIAPWDSSSVSHGALAMTTTGRVSSTTE